MKKITLSKGQYALIDDEDFERVSQFSWFALTGWKGKFYAGAWIDKKIVKMHRFLMNEIDPKIIIDHKDRDGLNNQRDNLRVATLSQNNSNRNGFGISKYLGVCILRPNKSNKKILLESCN